MNLTYFRPKMRGNVENKNNPVNQSLPSPRGALVGLAPPNKAPSPTKLKHETPHVSGIFVKFECQAPPART